jgi:hypothetical protein
VLGVIGQQRLRQLQLNIASTLRSMVVGRALLVRTPPSCDSADFTR